MIIEILKLIDKVMTIKTIIITPPITATATTTQITITITQIITIIIPISTILTLTTILPIAPLSLSQPTWRTLLWYGQRSTTHWLGCVSNYNSSKSHCRKQYKIKPNSYR
jgi:hypothetical protein